MHVLASAVMPRLEQSLEAAMEETFEVEVVQDEHPEEEPEDIDDQAETTQVEGGEGDVDNEDDRLLRLGEDEMDEGEDLDEEGCEHEQCGACKARHVVDPDPIGEMHPDKVEVYQGMCLIDCILYIAIFSGMPWKDRGLRLITVMRVSLVPVPVAWVAR